MILSPPLTDYYKWNDLEQEEMCLALLMTKCQRTYITAGGFVGESVLAFPSLNGCLHFLASARLPPSNHLQLGMVCLKLYHGNVSHLSFLRLSLRLL